MFKTLKILSRHIAVGLVALLVSAVMVPSFAKSKKKAKAVSSVVKTPMLSKNDRKRYDYFFLEGVRQQVAGNYDAAFDLLNHARQINPDAAEVYYYQALYFFQLENDSLGIAYLKKAADLSPSNDTYLESIAQYYISQQQFDDAAAAYESLYAHNHDNTGVLRMLLRIYQQQKQYHKMLSTIKRLELAEGESEEITLSKMQIYEMMDDRLSAYKELKSLTEKHPFDVSYKVMLGNWLVQNGKMKEASKVFAAVQKEEPDNASLLASYYDYYKAVGQEEEANVMLDKILTSKHVDDHMKTTMIRQVIQQNEAQGGDSTQVLQLFNKVLALPQTSSTMAELRAAYMNLKKMPKDSVNAAFQKVLDIEPDNANARLQLLQSLWEDKKYDEVVSMAQQAEAYNPDEMVFYYFGGMAYYQKGDEDATLETFRKALGQVKAESDPSLVSDLYMMMGDILHKKNKMEEAFAAYDSCLQWKDDNYPGLNNYAYYLSLQGTDLHRAELMSYKAIKAEPENSTYLDTYAWILFMEERYAEAKLYIDQTIMHMDSTESNGTLYEHAGDIYAMNGLKDEAVDYWKKALELDAGNGILKWKIENKQYITEENFNKRKQKK